MDTITHGIAGTLVAKSFLSEREGRIATLTVGLGSIFPDSDIFLNLFYRDRIAFLQIHRGLTHSLVALPVFALLFGVLTCRLTRQREKWLLFSCFYGIGIGSHILLDLITPFGTMLWSPLSNTRVYWDMTFIIDVALTTIVLLPQLTAWVYSDRERARQRGYVVWLSLTVAGVAVAMLTSRVQVPISGKTVAIASLVIGASLVMPSLAGCGFRWRRSSYCKIGMAVLAIYLGLCGMAHQAALARVTEYAKKSGIIVEKVAALPSPPSFLHWSGLVKSPDGIYRGSIDLGVSGQQDYTFFPNGEANQYIRTAESLEDTRTFLWFARFPLVTYDQRGGLHVVEIRDIQFFWPRRGATFPFTFQVSLDNQGHVLSSGLLNR